MDVNLPKKPMLLREITARVQTGDKKLTIYLPLYASIHDFLQYILMQKNKQTGSPSTSFPQKLLISVPEGDEMDQFCALFAKDHQLKCFTLDITNIIHADPFLRELNQQIFSNLIDISSQQEGSKSPSLPGSENPQKIPVSDKTTPQTQTTPQKEQETEKLTSPESKTELVKAEPFHDLETENNASKSGTSASNNQKTKCLLLIDLRQLSQLFLASTPVSMNEHFFSVEILSRNLLNVFFGNDMIDLSAIMCVIVLVNDEHALIESSSVEFDMFLRVQKPELGDRKQMLDYGLMTIPKKDVDTDHLALQMGDWSIRQINQFCKFAIKKFDMLTQSKPDLIFNTQFLLNLLLEIPYSNWMKRTVKNSEGGNRSQNAQDDSSNIESNNTNPWDNFTGDFENQLYQSVANQAYDDLVLILDKLQKGIILQPHERKLLADYPFLIREDPMKALIKLNRAKDRLNRMKSLKSINEKSSDRKLSDKKTFIDENQLNIQEHSELSPIAETSTDSKQNESVGIQESPLNSESSRSNTPEKTNESAPPVSEKSNTPSKRSKKKTINTLD